jgi:hypothetical protein
MAIKWFSVFQEKSLSLRTSIHGISLNYHDETSPTFYSKDGSICHNADF